MKNMLPSLRDEYIRWSQKLRSTEDSNGTIVSLDEVLKGHYLLVDYFVKEGDPIGACGPRDMHLLPSAVSRQVTGYGRALKWKHDTEKLASLFFGLIKNHPFHDGNKRTALLMVLYGLWKIHRIPTASQRDFERLALRTAANGLGRYTRFSSKDADAEVMFLADYFRRNTRREDKRYYVVTYAELNTILSKYDCAFEDPSGNYIHVVKTVEKKVLLGLRRKYEKHRVLKVGFPRWNAEVNQKALRSILKATGLTPENGIDSQVLFKGAEPLIALIDKYRNPLRRLRDK